MSRGGCQLEWNVCVRSFLGFYAVSFLFNEGDERVAEVRNGDGAGWGVQQMEKGALFSEYCSSLFLFLQATLMNMTRGAKLLDSAVKGVACLASLSAFLCNYWD